MSAKSHLMASIQQKRAAETKAVKWVECLIEPDTPTSVLEEAIQYIEPRHYNDVIEERFIEKLCGWPLCGNKLVNIPTKKYHISLKERKVLDLSDTKRYCSSLCYQSSVYIASQISTEPVWARKSTSLNKVKLKFLNSEDNSLLNGPPPSQPPSQHNDSIEYTTNPTSTDCTSSSNTSPTNTDPTSSDHDHFVKLLEDSIKQPDSSGRSNSNNIIVIERLQKVTLEYNYSTDSDDDDNTIDKPTVVAVIDKCCNVSDNSTVHSVKDRLARVVKYWYCIKTREWLREYCKENEIQDKMDDSTASSIGTVQQPGLDIGESVRSIESMKGPSVCNDGDSNEVYLPSVHGSETNKIQKNIFIQQFKTNLSQVGHCFLLNVSRVLLTDVISLAKTFRLSNDTIVFKPSEWKIIICVLIIRLGVSDSLQSNDQVGKWLNSCSLAYDDLLDLTKILT